MVSAIPYPHLKGKPHWRRTLAVYAALDNAPSEATYEQLIEFAKQATGKKCSRKLITKWKKERHLKSAITHQLSLITDHSPPKAIPLENYRSDAFGTLRAQRLSTIPEWLKRVTTVGAIATTIVGLGWLLTPEDKYKPLAIAQAPLVTQTTPLPTRKPPALEPREIKIELSLISPQDLKVKPGDKIKPGQVLSDRTTERKRIQNQRRQLELSLKQLEIAIPQSNAPKSIPILRKLPPISHQQEETNISLKQQELREAQKAIAHQQEKIEQLQKLLPKPEASPEAQITVPNSSPSTSEPPQEKSLPLPSPESPTQSNNSVAIIIEHEQAILKQLEESLEKARIQLTIAQSQLTVATEKRQQDEYQLHLEENRRAIALQNQQLELERQRTIHAGQLQEKEYSKAQIQAKIQEVDNAIAQLSTVKAPYPGTVKKVKWKGQTDRTLLVELTLDVDDSSTSRTPTLSRQ